MGVNVSDLDMALVEELCYIYHKRNLLGQRRDILRQKYKYLQDVKRIIQVKDNFKNSETFHKLKNTVFYNSLTTGANKADIEAEARNSYLLENPLPKKFKDTTLSEMNLMLLEAEKLVVESKIDVMTHTNRYDTQLKKINLTFSPQYVCGIVKNIVIEEIVNVFYEGKFNSSFTRTKRVLTESDIKKYHDEYLANKEIDKMLRS